MTDESYPVIPDRLSQSRVDDTISRERIATIYQAVKKEHQYLLDLAAEAMDRKEWALMERRQAHAAGLHFALRLLHQELGYQ